MYDRTLDDRVENAKSDETPRPIDSAMCLLSECKLVRRLWGLRTE